jgi:hypothetical protein
LPRDAGYYGSLFRYTERSHFERAGTLAAIATGVVLQPWLDWVLEAGNSGAETDAPDFGIERPHLEPNDPNPAVDELADLALEQKAFSAQSQAVLEAGGSERDVALTATATDKAEFARQQLIGMIYQVLVAGDTGVSSPHFSVAKS